MNLPPPPSGFKPDPLGTFESMGVKITNGFRTPADTARIRAQGYKPAENSLHLDADALDLTPGDSGLTMGQLYGRARQIAAQWPGAKVLNERHHIHIQLPGWGGAPGLPEPPPGFLPEGQPEQATPSGPDTIAPLIGNTAPANPLIMGADVFAGSAPAAAPPVAPAAEPRRPTGPLEPGLGDAEAPVAPTTSQTGTESSVDPAHTRQLQAAFDKGARYDQLTGMMRQFGIELNPGDLADLRSAIEWRNRNGRGARIVGETRSVETKAPAPEPQASLTSYQPDLAERIGDAVGDAANPLLGRVGGNRFGDKVEGLLDWTSVGDVDAYNQFGEAQDRAAQEGRYLDQFGNMVGQDAAAVSMLPIVGAAKRGIKAAGRGAESLVDRLFGLSRADEAASVAARGADNLPPSPSGFMPVDEPQIGRVRPVGQEATAEEIATAARGVRPEDVTPIPANAVERPEELPGSLAQLEAPKPGRAPRKPSGFTDYLKGQLKNESAARGLRVRIDAEDAIDKGVPAELIYLNPNEADKARLRLRNPSVFGTRYGKMSGTQQVLRSLDMDGVDPEQWGFDHVGRLAPEDIGDLLRRDLEGDSSALMRGGAYDDWSAHQERLEQRAEFEGRFPDGPPVERRGEPITPADLEANAPPATAYEDLPTLGGKVANINIAKLETRGDIRRALQNVETRFGGFDAARRGKISQAETARLADELGMTVDDLLRRRKGQALNAEQALQARRILAQSGDELVRLAQKTQGGSDEDLATFQRALVRHAAIQEQVTGATAEAGRTLAQFKMIAKAKEARLRVLKGLIDGYGGRGRIEDVAEAILDLQRDPGRLNSFALAATKPKLKDKLVELWINSLLTGPQTHAVNMVSNTVTQLGQIPEHAAAAVIGAARRAINPQAVDRVLFSEVGARSIGMVSGVKRGIINGARAFATETPSDYMAKAEQLQQRAISGTKGMVLRIPTRLLMGADEVFKGIARQSAMDGMAVRIANREGLKGDAAKQRIAELAANPTEEMLTEAFDYARYVTFQRPTGSFGQGVMRWKQDMPLLALVVPFVRTPTNLLKYAVERSPLAPLLKEWRADYAAGGAKRDLALARAFVGSGIGASIMLWAGDGKITGGGPADENAVKLMRADGWQPYSVKIGDKWVSYQRLDPYATILGIASDLATKRDKMTPAQQEKGAAILVTAVLKQLESKTWVSGLADLIKAVDDPQRHGQSFIDRLGGSIAVPTGVAQVARVVDPIMRDKTDFEGIPSWLDSLASRVVSRIPYASKGLPERRDLWGKKITSEGGAGPDFLSPLWVSSNRNDPVAREMLRIGARFGNLGKTSNGVRIPPEQMNAYQERAGRYTYEGLAEVIADPEWEALPDAERVAWVDRIKADARAAARDELGVGIPPPPPGFAPAR